MKQQKAPARNFTKQEKAIILEDINAENRDLQKTILQNKRWQFLKKEPIDKLKELLSLREKLYNYLSEQL